MRVFLSHASRDKPLVREIRRHLPEHIQSWIDEKRLLIGDDIEGSIKDAIENESDLVIIFLGRDSMQSDWVKRELAWALEREKELGAPFVLPVLFDREVWDCVEPKEFRSRKYILCSDFSEAGVAHTAKFLNEELFAHLSRKVETQPADQSRVELIDMPVHEQAGRLSKIGKGLLVECSAIEPQLNLPYATDFIGQEIFFPLIDLKLKNSGSNVAYLTYFEIAVEDVKINPIPILEFYICTTKDRDILLQVKNCGWGPACDACIENLHDDELRKHLSLMQKDYFWRGDIEAEQVVDIVIPRSSILKPARTQISGSPGFITYFDSNGKEYAFQFRYSPYPFEEYIVLMDNNGFDVKHRDYARAREPSARYNILLPTETAKYTKRFNISHEVSARETERFQIMVASQKSADFQLSLRVGYDSGREVVSDNVSLSVVNPNDLWYYSYLKPSWVSRGAAVEDSHAQTEVLIRTIFPEAGDPFKEVFLRGENVIRVKEEKKASERDRRNRESSAIALNNIAWILIDEDLDIPEGIRKARLALDFNSNDPYLMDTLALGHYKQGAYDQAVKWWEMAQQHGLDDDELRECLRKARNRLKQMG